MDELISVIMPLYNEEKYISSCVNSLLKQDYPKKFMEWIFVDGGSTDATVSILKSYQERFPLLLKIYENPDKTVPFGMNIGIRHARGKYIIRMDAHADYPVNYISECVSCLNSTDADNVGGIAETKSRGFIGNAIALMLSSKFGVGNSRFRTEGHEGYVDTVPFGAFRREVFQKWGGYDERLTRNQDNEMNYRIRSNGGKIYLSKRIRFSYYCRDSLHGICNMAVQNGMWNIITMKLCPGSMGIRHFVPLVFLLSLILMPFLALFFPFFRVLLAAELLLYFSLDLYFTFKICKCFKYAVAVFFLFPIFHISYGLGSIKGLFKLHKYN